jgi:hypothetical protein
MNRNFEDNPMPCLFSLSSVINERFTTVELGEHLQLRLVVSVAIANQINRLASNGKLYQNIMNEPTKGFGEVVAA